MIDARDIKQKSIIAALEVYKKEIDLVSDAISQSASRGEFMLYYDAKKAGIKRNTWTAILNVLDNAGFKTGIKDEKLLITWFSDLASINLLEDYAKERPY